MNRKAVYYLLSLCLGISSSYAFIMGEDNREILTHSEQQIAAIKQTGLIHIQDNEFATGIVTGANCDVLITAGHTARHWQTIERKGWKKGALRGDGPLTFYSDPEISNGIKMKLVRSGYEIPENIGADKHDWSIFRLASPAARNCKTISYLEQEISCKGKIMMPAFHFDKPKTKLIDRTCAIKNAIAETVIVHDCDTKEGSSGAPVLCRTGNEHSLIGINIGGLTHKAYEDWGVYGKEGDSFRYKKHENYAVSIHGEFLKTLKEELNASKLRKKQNGQKTKPDPGTYKQIIQ